MTKLDDAIAELYGASLDAFTSARNDLAKRLAGEGKKAEAATVKALKKPAVAVWAVNQLARNEPDVVAALIDASKALKKAQLEGEAETFREATQAQRKALSDATKRLHHAILSAATVDKASALLRAAAIDEGARKALLAGVLTEDVEGRGFDELAGLVQRPKPRLVPPPEDDEDEEDEEEDDTARLEEIARAKTKAQLEKLRAAVAEAREEEAARESDVKAANKELREAQSVLSRAENAVAQAASRLERASEKTREAQARVEDLTDT